MAGVRRWIGSGQSNRVLDPKGKNSSKSETQKAGVETVLDPQTTEGLLLLLMNPSVNAEEELEYQK
jgi:hypothetical protein